MCDEMQRLSGMRMFSGIEACRLPELLQCLGARREAYRKGSFIIAEGDAVYDFGLLLSGSARAVKWDASGRLVILTLLREGGEVGVVLAASLAHKSPVTVEAQDDVSILRIPFEGLFTRCKDESHRHGLLLRNYINIVSEKGLVLHERIDCLLRPTVREKIWTYLTRVARERQKSLFSIPMDRNAMAEYLNVERSALSRELSSMKRDGLLEYYKNTFRIL